MVVVVDVIVAGGLGGAAASRAESARAVETVGNQTLGDHAWRKGGV